jgi:hypothetical protein
MRPTDPLGAAIRRAGEAAAAVAIARPPPRRTRMGALQCATWAAYGDVLSMDVRLWLASCMWEKCGEMGLDTRAAMCICLPGARAKSCPLHELEAAFGDLDRAADCQQGWMVGRMGAAVVPTPETPS